MRAEQNHDDGAEAARWSVTANPTARVQMSGDEREQTVLLEAVVRGNRVLIDALLGLALVTALFGNWLVPAVLLAILSLSARLSQDYAYERRVDSVTLAERSGRTLRRVRSVLAFLAMMLTFGAMSYRGVTGAGLLPGLDVVTTGPEAGAFVRTAAWSIPMWAAVGTVVLVIREAVKRRRSARAPRA